MFGASRKNLTMLNKLCGDDALKNVILATTKWSHADMFVILISFSSFILLTTALNSGGGNRENIKPGSWQDRGMLVSLRNVVIKYYISDIQVPIEIVYMGLMETVQLPPAFGEGNPQITTVPLFMRAPFMDVRDWTLLSWCPWAGTPRDVPYAN
jgi:hypothetical protein